MQAHGHQPSVQLHNHARNNARIHHRLPLRGPSTKHQPAIPAIPAINPRHHHIGIAPRERARAHRMPFAPLEQPHRLLRAPCRLQSLREVDGTARLARTRTAGVRRIVGRGRRGAGLRRWDASTRALLPAASLTHPPGRRRRRLREGRHRCLGMRASGPQRRQLRDDSSETAAQRARQNARRVCCLTTKPCTRPSA
jgi:hypothetical protein